VTEVEKVTGLDDGQVSQLMTQGFSQLKITISTEDMAFLQRYMIHMTLGIAQRVHELCSCIAYEIQDHSWKFIRELLNSASAKWLNDSLRSSYVVIESHLNSIETTVGRRNQVIYAIGQINRSPILSADIEKYIREKFPDSIPETNMGIGSILTELCDSDNPILKKSDKHNHYVVLDPLHIMAIRLVLRKDSATNKIVKRTFKRN
jgi:hypothetical protein